MVKTIIFDMGGVIITLDQPEAVRRFQELGIKDADKRLDAYTQTGIFGDVEGGRISAEQFRVEASKLAGRELTYDDCCYGFQGYSAGVPEEKLQALLRLRKEGYRVLVMSNTNQFMMEWVNSERFDGNKHPLKDYVDKMYLSYQVRMMKPDEMFFRYVMSEERIMPNETLFVDDSSRNCAAASEMGIRTFCPKNGEDWTQEIYEYIK
jgi:5-amino-6-(5-phospho-D-ribitylamino)uracil phosphatase